MDQEHLRTAGFYRLGALLVANPTVSTHWRNNHYIIRLKSAIL